MIASQYLNLIEKLTDDFTAAMRQDDVIAAIKPCIMMATIAFPGPDKAALMAKVGEIIAAVNAISAEVENSLEYRNRKEAEKKLRFAQRVAPMLYAYVGEVYDRLHARDAFSATKTVI